MSDLYKEEYQTLRKEVETAMSELNTLEISALGAVSAIFTWLVTREVGGVVQLGWCIPFILVVLCVLRTWAIGKQLEWLSDYLTLYEKKFIRPELIGWEHFLCQNVAGKPRRGVRGLTTKIFWMALLLVTFTGGAFGLTTSPLVLDAAKDVSHSKSPPAKCILPVNRD